MRAIGLRQRKYLFLTIQQFVFLVYFILTTMIFFIGLKLGNEGITAYIFGGDDGFFYWEQAKNIAAGRDAILTSIYPLIIGYLIKITGIESVYIIRIFNYCGFILLVLLSIYLIEMLFKLEGRKIESKYALSAKILLLVCFLFYASLQMNVNLSIYRDIWIYTLYVLSIILSIRIIFYKKKRFLYLLLLIPSLWLLGAFRRYALLSFLLTIIIYYGYRKFKGSKKPYGAIIVVLIFFGIYYTFFMDYIVPIVNMSLRAALNYRLSSLIINFGGSQMWISLDHGNFFIFLINYFHSYIGNLLGPLPWHISGTATLFVFFVESIPMTLILMFLWRKRNLISSVQKYVLLHSFIWISLIAVSNDNIGTATRLRPVAWILIIIVFVSVYSKNRYFKNNKISIKLNS